MLEIVRTDTESADFLNLVKLLDADLRIRDGEDHAFYAQFNKTDKLKNCVVAYLDKEPVGSGALRPLTEDAMEVKRMFVQPAYRSRGIAGEILKALENWAAELNYKACMLETGKNQPEAIRLYQKSGYSIIPNYGQYEHIENSVCMKKELKSI
jgi:GNAT superfamily N-acetyltransferase